jgi:hypothetical protein
MKSSLLPEEAQFFRTLLALVLIVIAAALRVAPHPWNFTPIGAMALFSGAIVRDRRIAFLFPLLALFAGDLFAGLYNFKVMLMVYASFLVSVLIGRLLQRRRTLPLLAGATFLGALQFFLITNFAMWWLYDTYSKSAAGLAACYVAGLPLFWNTLGGDAVYVAVLFGGYALAEHFFPTLREPAPLISIAGQSDKKQ